MGTFLAEYGDLIDQVQSLCVLLRTPNNSAQLAVYTPLKALTANVTRWSSTFKMLRRYVDIRDAIKHVPAAEELLPRPSDHRRIVQLVEKLEDLDSVCIQLQAERCTLLDARVLFDAVIAKYPVVEENLRVNARVVHSPIFENGVVKLLRDQPLLAPEAIALARFVVDNQPPARNSKKESFATATLRQAKKQRVASAALYSELLRKIPPTSNRVERLFSQCKLVLTPCRSSMLPSSFETIVFLRANRALWGFSALRGCEE